MKKKILVIGSLNMDQSIRLDRMPLVGETVMGRASYIRLEEREQIRPVPQAGFRLRSG